MTNVIIGVFLITAYILIFVLAAAFDMHKNSTNKELGEIWGSLVRESDLDIEIAKALKDIERRLDNLEKQNK